MKLGDEIPEKQNVKKTKKKFGSMHSTYLGRNDANNMAKSNSADVTLQNLQLQTLHSLQHIALEFGLRSAHHMNNKFMRKVQEHFQLLHAALQLYVAFTKLFLSRKAPRH
jgi:hypothetical protein